MIEALINGRCKHNGLLWCTGAGNDFSSAKELKAEMKAVYQEQDRLDALAKRLHSLSSGSSQELARMKEQRQQLRQELEQREAQHGESLTTVYIKITWTVFIPKEKRGCCRQYDPFPRPKSHSQL